MFPIENRTNTSSVLPGNCETPSSEKKYNFQTFRHKNVIFCHIITMKKSI